MEHDDDDDHPIPEGHSSRNFRKRDSFELEAGTTSLSHQSKVIIYYFNYVNVIVICTLIILLFISNLFKTTLRSFSFDF
jgi:hypothetical protein